MTKYEIFITKDERNGTRETIEATTDFAALTIARGYQRHDSSIIVTNLDTGRASILDKDNENNNWQVYVPVGSVLTIGRIKK